MILDKEQYKEVLLELEKRTDKSRRVTAVFMASMIIIFSAITSSVILMEVRKNSNQNFTSEIFTPEMDYAIKEAINSLQLAKQELKNAEVKNATEINSLIKTSGGTPTLAAIEPKSSIDKILEIAAPILLAFSALLFFVYILRLFIIFLKYNMQMSNDYDNQKISFLLSGGDTSEFGELLQKVRSHNISFEKTPNLPQEKIITELIELLKSTKGKN